MTKTVVIVMAMEAEAKPFVEHLQLKKDETIFPKGFKAECYAGSLDTTKVYLILNGKCHKYNVDIVGTVGGAVTTFAAIQALHPDVIINAGTCGGFKAMGGEVGSIYLCTRFLNHDRRIAIPGFDAFGVGELKTVDLNQGLLDHVGAKNGVVSTGNSLDMVKEDEHYIKLHKATCKDMEGAAVAYICDQLGVPMFALKSVTDIVDGEHPTPEEFLKNLGTAAKCLQEALPKVLSYISQNSFEA
ncbi:nucleoside phosphorylase [Chloropicon primus]|nr:nucleoside phosphorylase [Chloropicon primus]